MAGGNLTITTSGAIDNQRGLLQADDTLTLTASSLDNNNTLTASNAPAKGVLGKVVSIVAGRVNNQGGAISAGQDLASRPASWTTPPAKPPRKALRASRPTRSRTRRASCWRART